MAQEGEETGDCKGFIAVTNDIEVNGMKVKEVRQKGNDGIDGDHEEDTDDTV